MRFGHMKKLLATILLGAWGIMLSGACLAAEKGRPKPEDCTRLVYKESGKHCGFPNLLRLANGDLLAHFRVGIGHSGDPGPIAQVRSTDQGETWGEFRVIPTGISCDHRTTSSGIQLPNGKILLPFYQWGGRWEKPGPRGGERLKLGPMIIVSTDNGKTWSKAIRLPNPFPAYAHTCGKIIRLADGTLLLGIHGGRDKGHSGTGIVRSVDDGETWTDFVNVAPYDTRAYYEPSFAILADGDILALNRTEPEPYMYKCFSKDNGRTWSKPVRTEIQGDVPELIVLPSGNILCSYRSQEPGTRDTRMCISRDQGKTWVNEKVIDPNGGDHGYTSSVLLDDGSVYTVNYCRKDGLTQIRSKIVTESDFNEP